MTQIQIVENDVIQGEVPSEEELFLLEWGRETRKQTIPRLNDALQRIITLSTTMLGGSLFFLKSDIVPDWFRGGSMVVFLIAFLVAFHGSEVHDEVVDVRQPDAIRLYKQETTEHRRSCLKLSTRLLWVGMFVSALGALLKFAQLA